MEEAVEEVLQEGTRRDGAEEERAARQQRLWQMAL